jgi:hypothetical protein
MILGRLLLRFLVVPLGAGAAILTAVLFVIVAHWSRFAALAGGDRAGDEFAVALFFLGSWIVLVASVSAMAMLLPATIGVVLAEVLAIRSWIFHATNGGLSAWIGLREFVEMREPDNFYGDPLIVIAAGIAAGFAYWAVAGWSAGFWKPVFAQSAPTPVSPPAAPA